MLAKCSACVPASLLGPLSACMLNPLTLGPIVRLGAQVLQRLARARERAARLTLCVLVPLLPDLIVRAGAQVLQRLSRARERQRVSTGGAAGPDDRMGPDFGGGGGESDDSGDEEVTAAPGNPARRSSTGAAAAPPPGLSGMGERGPGDRGL